MILPFCPHFLWKHILVYIFFVNGTFLDWMYQHTSIIMNDGIARITWNLKFKSLGMTKVYFCQIFKQDFDFQLLQAAHTCPSRVGMFSGHELFA